MIIIRKFFKYLLVFMILVLLPFIYWRFYYPVADGTQAGMLNVFQKKGLVFKTYEGKLIQSGFKANIQSNEFSFSVTIGKGIKSTLQAIFGQFALERHAGKCCR
jgi:hypothetical protein